MIFKVVFGITGGITLMFTTLSLVSSSYSIKLDRNVLRPIRNYRENMKDMYKLQTQEEFYDFLTDFSTGLGKMFSVENNNNE